MKIDQQLGTKKYSYLGHVQDYICLPGFKQHLRGEDPEILVQLLP